MMKTISVIFGTRPEAIKLAPVILALQRERGVRCRVCVTGQHREMLQNVSEVFGIVPDVNLRLMRPNQDLAGLTARAVGAVDKYLAQERPQLVLVQGDTTTVFAAALAAFYRKVPVGHVEAGLRTWNLQAPWPEEANRVLTSRLTTMHFAPTEGARQNLLREAVPDNSILVTGNTIVDALLLALEKVKTAPPFVPELPDFLQPGQTNGGPEMVLITGHRRENFGEGFESICLAIGDLARRFPEVHFVYPVHLNPNVREPVMRLLSRRIKHDRNGSSRTGLRAGNTRTPPRNNIHLIEPLSYLPFVGLMDRAALILTDSGGVQEEAPTLKKPVLVMRDATERPEGLAIGTIHLVGTNRDKIFDGVSRLLNSGTVRTNACRSTRPKNPYGDGRAAARIAKACAEFLEATPDNKNLNKV